MVQASAVFVALADFDGRRLKAFYRALLDLEPAIDIPQVYTEFQLPQLRIGLFRPNVAHQAEFLGASSGGMSLCLEVGNLEAAVEQLTQLGCPPPETIRQASHGREIYAYDPCGNRLIFHESFKDVLA